MSMRISDPRLLLLPLLLTACGKGEDRPVDTKGLATAEAEQRAQAEEDGRILCARGGMPMRRDCTVEQSSGPRGLILTIRHPDGSFQRLLATRDGRGVVAADGAQAADVSIVGTDGIDVTLGDAHYRLPATVKP